MATLDGFLRQGRSQRTTSARHLHADEDDRSVASSVATELYYKMKQELELDDAAEFSAAAAQREEEERLRAQGYHSSQVKLIRTASGTPVYDRDAARRAYADARAFKKNNQQKQPNRQNRSLSPVRQHSQKNFGRSNRSGSSRSLSPTRPTTRPSPVSPSRSPRHRRCDTFQRDTEGTASGRPTAGIRSTREEDSPRGVSPTRRNYHDNNNNCSSPLQRSQTYDNHPVRGAGSQRNLHQTSHERSYQSNQRNDYQNDTSPRERSYQSNQRNDYQNDTSPRERDTSPRERIRTGGAAINSSQHQHSHHFRGSVTETASVTAPTMERRGGSPSRNRNTSVHNQDSYLPPMLQHRQQQQPYSPPLESQEHQHANPKRELMGSLRDSAHSCVSDITEFSFGNHIDEGYAATPVPPMRQQHAPAPSRQAQNPNEMMIEIQPGFSLPLRGAQETTRAVEINFVVLATCMVCTVQAKCIADAEYVLCPVCRSVSPIEANAGNNGGVGLGLEVS